MRFKLKQRNKYIGTQLFENSVFKEKLLLVLYFWVVRAAEAKKCCIFSGRAVFWNSVFHSIQHGENSTFPETIATKHRVLAIFVFLSYSYFILVYLDLVVYFIYWIFIVAVLMLLHHISITWIMVRYKCSK